MTDFSLRAEGLTICYGSNQVVTDASFTLQGGTTCALIGPNGAGKSTLMRAVLGLIPSRAGKILVGGKPLNGQRKEIAYVSQRGEVDWNFPITVEQTAMLGTYPKLGLFKRANKKSRAAAHAALKQVDLLDLKDRPIAHLSGGQQQRMFLARALAQDPKLILLDEPFAAVDAKSEKVIVGVLNKLKERGAALLIVHHDLSTLTEYFDQVIVLNNTVLAVGKPQEILNSAELAAAYSLPTLATGVSAEDQR